MRKELNHLELQKSLEIHRQAVLGNLAAKRIDLGTFYEKKLDGFLMENIKELDQLRFDDVLLTNCIFRNVEFPSAIFYESTLGNCVFQNCEFVKAEFQFANISNCIFDQCGFFGCMMDGVLKNCVFASCNIDRFLLSESTITDTVFSNNYGTAKFSDNVEKNVIWGT
jgi:uncharacterized protein YjbI with pentapeptide repeats